MTTQSCHPRSPGARREAETRESLEALKTPSLEHKAMNNKKKHPVSNKVGGKD